MVPHVLDARKTGWQWIQAPQRAWQWVCLHEFMLSKAIAKQDIFICPSLASIASCMFRKPLYPMQVGLGFWQSFPMDGLGAPHRCTAL
jgi:hypothetical protein